MDSFTRSRHASLTMIDRQLIRYTGGGGIVCTPVDPGGSGVWACLVLGVHSGHWPWVACHTDMLKAIVAAVVEALKSRSHDSNRGNHRATDIEPTDTRRIRRIVHEINNPLSIIKNYLSVLGTSGGDPHMDRDALEIIDGEINRVTELVQSLTRSGEDRPARRESIDLNAMILETMALFDNLTDRDPPYHIDHDLDERIPTIVLDGDRLKQALINLLKNAMEALSDGGSIRVRTRLLNTVLATEDPPAYENTIRISVCDDGPGIDDQVKDNLFKSHVTSKNGHDGLGLPIVMDIVRHFDGILRVESTSGRGTCFHIELPAGKVSALPTRKAAPEPSMNG
jgi:signal transduction histidine kinase